MALWLWAETAYAIKVTNPPVQIQQTNPEITPCVKAMLDGEPIIHGEGVKKSTEGTLEVKMEETSKIYFNLVLKSYIGADKPPLYLRFVKVDSLDIQKVLRYANIGDEIFIEPYSNDNGFKCLPSHFIVT